LPLLAPAKIFLPLLAAAKFFFSFLWKIHYWPLPGKNPSDAQDLVPVTADVSCTRSGGGNRKVVSFRTS